MGKNQVPIWTPLYLHRRALAIAISKEGPEVLAQTALELRSPKLRILDLGCGSMPYRSTFEGSRHCGTYDGADIGSSMASVIRIDPLTQKVAAPDASYDVVLHFQVMEHVRNTRAFLSECRRLIHSSGRLYFTAPFLFEYHAVPDDYYRWTASGLRQELAEAGFQVERVQAVESDWQSALTVLELAVANSMGYRLTKPLFLLLNLLGLSLGRSNRGRAPLTFSVVATRTADSVPQATEASVPRAGGQ